jgi:hypothetical protein
MTSFFDTLKDQLALERHGGRTPAGVYARIAQRADHRNEPGHPVESDTMTSTTQP